MILLRRSRGPTSFPAVLIVWVVLGAGACSTEAPPPTGSAPVLNSDPTLRANMLDEEDARGTGPSGIQFLREGLLAPDAELQRVAVRAIGRFEDSQFVPLTFPLLFSGDETVRAEAINAQDEVAVTGTWTVLFRDK